MFDKVRRTDIKFCHQRIDMLERDLKKLERAHSELLADFDAKVRDAVANVVHYQVVEKLENYEKGKKAAEAFKMLEEII